MNFSFIVATIKLTDYFDQANLFHIYPYQLVKLTALCPLNKKFENHSYPSFTSCRYLEADGSVDENTLFYVADSKNIINVKHNE